jgi:hypothetical protein
MAFSDVHKDFMLGQCRLEFGVVTVNRWKVSGAAMKKLRENMARNVSDNTWEERCAKNYREHYNESPPGLGPECTKVLRDRIRKVLSELGNNEDEVAIENGCCGLEACPKRRYALTFLAVLADANK